MADYHLRKKAQLTRFPMLIMMLNSLKTSFNALIQTTALWESLNHA
jgi:hypothetical protein